MQKRRALALFALLAFIPTQASRASAPTIITISGTGAVVQVASTDLHASSIQFTAPNGNAGVARIGDANTTSSIGEALPAGAGQYFPPRWQGAYSLNEWYAYVANGDKLTIIWVDTN